MRRIDTANSLFTDGNPSQGIEATPVWDWFLNHLQEEIAQTIEGFGVVLDANNMHQLRDALQTVLAAKVSSSGGTMSANPTVALGVATKQYVDGIISLAASGYWQSPGGLILQWGKGTAPATGTTTSTLIVTFPVAFPNAPLGAWVTTAGHANSSTGGNPAGGAISLSTTSFQAVLDVLNQSITFNQTCDFYWFAIGH